METLYHEERQGQTPKAVSGGSHPIIEWQQQPSGFSQTSQILGTIMSTLEQEETKKQKKLQDKFDMYKTLREAGYDTRAAYDAIAKGVVPPTPPGETIKDQKDRAELEKTQAETGLAKEKTAAYARGDMGRKQSAADKMNAAQLQREIKRMSDPFENPDYDSEESKSYVSYLNQKLQQISQYPGANPPAADEAPAATTVKAPATGKIRVKRKKDGAIGTIDAKDFKPEKYERA